MSQEEVDKELAQELWGQMFDLQQQIREKATEAGLKPGGGCCKTQQEE